MSLPEDYRPCRNCGQLTDSGVCSPECANELDAELEAEQDADDTESDDELHWV